MRPRVRVNLIRLAMVSGALLATVPLTTVAFAWTQPICNPSTGEVLQPSHFADEAAYNKYLRDHPGSFEMNAGDRCVARVAQQAQAAAPPAGATRAAPATDTSTPAGTVVCVVNVNELGTTVEQRRVPDVTRWLSSHPGSFMMATGKDCGLTFTANLPTTANVSATTTANTSTTGSVADVALSPAEVTTATNAGPLTARPVEGPAFAGASLDMPGITVAGESLDVAGVTVAGESLDVAGVTFAGASLELPGVSIAGLVLGPEAELELAAEFQVPSIPPGAGDGTTADEIVP